MRHGDKVNNLGRKEGHRRALMRNLATALVEHKRIKTTLAKAKALRTYIEPLVTKAKSNTTHSRRVIFSYLQSKEAVKELFGPIAEKVGDRPGGYIRILRTGFRKGDGAEMAMIEFVDYNEIYKPGKAEDSAGAKKRRTRRGGSGTGEKTAAAATAKVAAPAAPPVVEEPEIEEAEEAAADTLEAAADEAANDLNETADDNSAEEIEK
ncbi:MAG: 50S ribosomal protein L17 [Saprospiraceae bacterium]|nr:50S ribosomal protein L17 [Saprospiraceae bacterium]